MYTTLLHKEAIVITQYLLPSGLNTPFPAANLSH